MRKRTASDDSIEVRVYEEAARREETYLMLRWKELMEGLPPPPGWHKKKGRGRPRKKKRGAQEEFTWQGMILVLLLKTLHGLTYRETRSHLEANPELRGRIGIPRAPSQKTMIRTVERLSEAWLKRLNRALADEPPKKTLAALARSEPDWIAQVWPSGDPDLGSK